MPAILLVIFVVLALLLRSIVAPLLLVVVQRPLVRGDHRHLGTGLPARARLPEQRPVDRALRVRVPRGARHRLLDLPDDAGARGGQGARDQTRHPRRPGRDRRRHHQRGHRSRSDVLGPGGAAAGLPGADRVHRRVRRAARHLRGALAARARGGLRHRAADLVAAPPGGRPASGHRAGWRRGAGGLPRPGPRLVAHDACRTRRFRVVRADHPRPAAARGGLRGRRGLDVRRSARADAARAEFPGTEVVPRLDDLLAVPGVDLVVLATPSGGHAAQVRAVVDAGIACLVDKPLAVDAAEAAAVVRYAAAAGVPLTVFHNRRYDPEQATVARVVADGLVGTPFRYEMRWERWRPVPKERWREKASASRGRRHPARPAQPPRRRGRAAVRAGGDGVRHRRRAHHPGRGRRVPRLPPHDGRGVAPRGDLAVGGSGPAGAAARHRGGVRDGRLHRRGARVERAGRRRRRRTAGGSTAATSGSRWRAARRRRPTSTARSRPRSSRADPQAAMPVDPWDAVHTLAVIDAARVSAAQGRVVSRARPRPAEPTPDLVRLARGFAGRGRRGTVGKSHEVGSGVRGRGGGGARGAPRARRRHSPRVTTYAPLPSTSLTASTSSVPR